MVLCNYIIGLKKISYICYRCILEVDNFEKFIIFIFVLGFIGVSFFRDVWECRVLRIK